MLGSFVRSNSKVTEPKDDSKDAGAGVNFTSSRGLETVEKQDTQVQLCKPVNQDIMASLNVESEPMIYPNLGFKIHTRTAAEVDA